MTKMGGSEVSVEYGLEHVSLQKWVGVSLMAKIGGSKSGVENRCE